MAVSSCPSLSHWQKVEFCDSLEVGEGVNELAKADA